MKPSDLKPPTKNGTFVENRIWYLPTFTDETYPFDGFDSPVFFGNVKPLYIEFCSGNGHWIAKRAQENASYNWLAVERKWERVRKIWSKMRNLNLDNLISVCGDAENLCEKYLQNDSVDGIYINFPDPWPKRRHAKNRIIQAPFIEQLARILKRGGKVTVVTDDTQFSDQIVSLFCQSSHFEPLDPHPHYSLEWEDYGSSQFEELWREKGKEVRYHRFRTAVS